MAITRSRKGWIVASVTIPTLLLALSLATGIPSPRVTEHFGLTAQIKTSETGVGPPGQTTPSKTDLADLEYSNSTHQARLEFDSMIRGDEDLDQYILRHLERAKAGDPDSAYFVAEAMMYCVLDMNMLDQTKMHWGIETTEPDKILALVMDKLVGQPEFHRHEALQHIERGLACERFGWDVSQHRARAKEWRDAATEANQPIAMARAAWVDPEDFDPTRLAESKNVIRGVLEHNREFLTLMYASSVVSAATGSDYEFERLAWGLLACEYDECDSLNFYYRGMCDMLSNSGNDICTPDMTDSDYLFRLHPAQFDIARARAQELKEAIDGKRWELIGLE